jgi:hypothetical protein
LEFATDCGSLLGCFEVEKSLGSIGSREGREVVHSRVGGIFFFLPFRFFSYCYSRLFDFEDRHGLGRIGDRRRRRRRRRCRRMRRRRRKRNLRRRNGLTDDSGEERRE